MATKTRFTAEDLLRMPDDGVRRELVNGEIVEMPPPNFQHGYVAGKIYGALAESVRESRAGFVAVGDPGFRLALPDDPERVRAPDVCFVSAERFPGGKVPTKFVSGAPDLAVEVLSPSESAAEIHQKVRDYLEGGAKLVWLFSAEAKTVAVFRADGSGRFLTAKDTLTGEPLLPGFSLDLGEFFSDPAL